MSENNQPQTVVNVTVSGPQKSMAVALILTFLFGPLGLFYASVTGGIVLLLAGMLTLVASFFTFGLASVFFPVIWIASMIWAALAAAGKEKAVITQVKQGNYKAAVDAAMDDNKSE